MTTSTTGKGKSQGHGHRQYPDQANRGKKIADNLLDVPPGLTKLKPLKKAKEQQLQQRSSWHPQGIQGKLQALGLGLPPQEGPELTDLLR